MPSSTAHADTIIRNANIITIDPDRPQAQSLAMRHGRFIAVGSNDDVAGLEGPGTKILDLSGKTVLPGFIDAHIHVLSSGIRHVMAADCSLPSISAIKDAMRQQIELTKSGEWVQGFKFDDTKTEENRFLTRQDLDEVSTELPILVSHRAGHVYYLNSKALETAGFTRDTPDPVGGRFGRDPSSGELDGVVYERAIEPVRYNHLPTVTPEDRRRGLQRICQMLTPVGLTSVHDARVTNDEMLTYQEGRDNGDLTLRAYILMAHDHFPALRDAGLKTGFGLSLIHISEPTRPY